MQSAAIDNQQTPVPVTSLVGRTEELARIMEMLARPDVRLVTLVGPGGVGKTRLALQILQDVDRIQFPHAHIILLANMVDAEGILPAIARCLGVHQMGTRPLDELIADFIGDRSMLLILDNAEQVAEHLMFVSTLLGACPNLTVLVTSRVTLRLSAEHVFPVDPLPTTSPDRHHLAAATALFIERAQAVRPDLPLTSDNVEAIDAICRQLDGLPLAIELAAARTRFLSPLALRDRLSERLQFLVGGPRDAPERHRTLRATLTWSHDLLTPDERVLFRRLAVCVNGVPYEAVEPICNASGDLGDRVEELLAALVDHSLVRIEDRPERGPRVRLLHTIREFAQEQLDLSGESEAVRRAHAQWYARMVTETPVETWRTGTPELRAWTMRYLPDLETFPTVLERLMNADEEVLALRMTGQLVPYWVELGQIREGRAWVHRTIPYIDRAPIDTQAHFLRMATIVDLHDDNLDVALAHAERALALAEVLNHRRLIANIQNLLGTIHWGLGDPAEGERFQRAAIASTVSVNDPLGAAIFTAQLAEQLMEARQFDRAEPLLAEALPVIARERPEAALLTHSATAFFSLVNGHLDQAGESLEHGLAYHRPPPHRRPDVLALLLLVAANLATRRGLPDAGVRLLAASVALIERIGFRVATTRGGAIAEDVMQELRTQLSPERYEAGEREGAGMPIPDAIEIALEVARVRSAAPLPEPESDHDLTPRERDVLALLAEGKSNAAIAEALFISQRTVTTHLSRLYAKLDVSTRTEAIALAVRLGLVKAEAEHT